MKPPNHQILGLEKNNAEDIKILHPYYEKYFKDKTLPTHIFKCPYSLIIANNKTSLSKNGDIQETYDISLKCWNVTFCLYACYEGNLFSFILD